MAGTYDDVPGQKIAYDVDGSVVVVINYLGVRTVQNLAFAQELLDYDATNAYTTPAGTVTEYVSIVFSQPRTLRGLWGTVERSSAGIGGNPSWGTQYSLNTTDGQDGTWTTLFADNIAPTWGSHGIQRSSAIEPENRTEIHTLASPITGVAGFRVKLNSSNTRDAMLRTLYLFGEVTSPAYLEFWHPTLDQALDGAYFDWGNTTIGYDGDRDFRIKNTNPTLQAHDVTVSFDTLAVDSPSPTTCYTVSEDGVTFYASRNIGHLAASTISGVLTVRRETDLAATLGLTELRIKAVTSGFG